MSIEVFVETLRVHAKRILDSEDGKFKLTYLLIEYGSNVHTAKKPIPCSDGPLAGLCPND